jgi:hypothetical protein
MRVCDGMQVVVRTGEGVEIRDSYVERRITAVRRSSLINSTADNVRSKPTLKTQWSSTAPDYVVGNETAAEPEIMLTSSSSTSLPRQSTLPPIVMQAVIGVNFIADHLKQQDEFNKVIFRLLSLRNDAADGRNCNVVKKVIVVFEIT